MTAPRLAVLGAGGRVGTLLRGSGAMPGATWFSRRGGEGLVPWDLLAEPAPQALRGVEVMICLAGAVPGAGLSDNSRLALAAARAADAAGIGHVLIASSIAVYGAGGAPWREDAPLRPQTDYGRAKVDMEAAVLARAEGRRCNRPAPEAGGALQANRGVCAPCSEPVDAAGRAFLYAQAARGEPCRAPEDASLQMGGPQICLLRLGNVVGADAISAAIAGGQPVTLDRCPGGGGPMRSMIGPVTLARVLMALTARARSGAGLPPVLNVAQPGPVAMAALCAAAGRSFGWRAAGPATLPVATLDTGALQALAPLPAADPAALIGEWRAAGGRV